eukprot:scaffold1661_cov251-Pinguiococcus_pyrenoidosus.AAC.16
MGAHLDSESPTCAQRIDDWPMGEAWCDTEELNFWLMPMDSLSPVLWWNSLVNLTRGFGLIIRMSQSCSARKFVHLNDW